MGQCTDFFIRQLIVVSGLSSGGLLATLIAANAPDEVTGLVIEDAPFFATESGCEMNNKRKFA